MVTSMAALTVCRRVWIVTTCALFAVVASHFSSASGDGPAATPQLAEPYSLEDPPRIVPQDVPRIWLAEFSPDGKLLATTAGWHQASTPFGPSIQVENGELVMWDLSKREPLYALPEANTVRSAAFSPNGKLLAYCLFDGKVKLVDVAAGKVVKVLGRHKAMANAVCFSPDGKTLVSCGFDQALRLWDVASGKPLKVFHTECPKITHVAFSPDGKKLATGDWEAPFNAQIWDAESGKVLHSLSHAKIVEAVAFSPDSRTLATASWTQEVRLWDAATGEEVLHKEEAGETAVVFSPDGKLLASCRNRQLSVWDLPDGDERWTVRPPIQFQSARFSRDGKLLAAACRQNEVRLYEAATGEEIATLKRTLDVAEPPAVVRAVAFSPDGKTLATAGDDGQIQLREPGAGRVQQTLKGFKETVTSLAFSPDGSLLAAASMDRRVKLFDTVKGAEKLALPAATGWVAAVAFSPDGKILATGGYDKTARLFNPVDGKELAVLTGHGAAVRAIAFSANGKRLASGSGDNTIKLWNLETKTEIATLEGHTGAVRSVAFGPDGRLVSGAEDGKIRFWDADGTARERLEAHRDMVWTLAFVGKDTLVSGGADGLLILWDQESKEQRQRFAAHSDALTSLAVSPGARYVATGGLDKSIKIWNAREKID